MKVLHYAWGAYNDKILHAKLVQLGLEVVVYNRKCVNYTRDMDMAAEIMSQVNAQGIEAIISFDYFPIISMAANVCKVPYYAWVYDSPHMTLQAKCINLPNNIIGVFERKLQEKLNANGISTVYHLPLPVDTKWFDKSIEACKSDFSADVSFVGSMYTDSHNYYKELNNGDREWKIVDEYVELQKFDYTKDYEDMFLDREDGKVSDYLENKMKTAGYVIDEDFYDFPRESVVDQILRRQVTVVERREILNAVASLCQSSGYNFKLYTGSDVSEYEKLINAKCPPVDYLTQMPKVFRHSKINLNITLRTIRTGIPLRALDIMASGGFLLSNPQQELADYLEENKDYVAYYSVEDCQDKIDFYLRNEDARAKVAQRGYEKVSEIFSYEQGLSKLFGF